MKIMFAMLPKVFAVLVLGAVHLDAPALAQSVPGSEDLRALRFYLENKQTSAVEAEINRLRAEFPGWTPPGDLQALSQSQSQPTTEVADIYARLARGDIEGARRVIQTTQARYPSWQMPPDLARQMEMSEAQLAFDRAVNSRDIAQTLRIGKKVPSLFRCDRINNAWNLAELQIAAGSPERALSAYSQTVRTCTTIPDLVATIEKAGAVATNAQLTALTDLASQRFPAQAASFAALNQRLLAGRGVAGKQAPAAPVAATVAKDPAPKVVDAPPVMAAPVADVMASPPPNTGQAATSLPRSGDSRLAQTRAAKESGAFRDCLARSARPGSLDIAYERAWCAYNLDRPLEAMAYFQAAAQGNMGGTVTRDAYFGLTLSMLKRGMTDSAAEVASRTDLTLEQRREVEIIILDQRGVAAFNANDNVAAIDYLDALEQIQGSLRRDLAIMRGYAYLKMGKKSEANARFQALHDTLATDETRRALNASR